MEFRDIRKQIGPFLLSLNLKLNPGEFFALIGPSGCGKTTTLHIAAGFVTPDSGSVHLEGEDITSLPPERRNLGLVFQQYALFPHLDVARNVGYGLAIRHRAKEEIRRRTETLLDLVRLPGFGSRSVHRLSGGEQQRIALARALAPHPRAMLLDEPLSALDTSLRTELRREIHRIQRESGIATLYVTHDQEEALSLADRIAVMRDGAIVQVGTPREVYECPVDSFSARFLGSANLIPDRVIGETERTVSVHTELGVFHSSTNAKNPCEHHRGDTCLLFFRPEHLLLVPESTWAGKEGSDGVNLFEGIVRYVEYLGERCLVEIDASGLALSARLTGRTMPGTGERIRFRIEPEELRLLPADP